MRCVWVRYRRWRTNDLDEILMPLTDGGGTLKVPALGKHDGGADWLRALDDDRRCQLLDLAGKLSTIFPILSDSRVTERQFYAKLKKLGQLESCLRALARVVGTHGAVGPYEIWWCHRYSYHYTRYATNSDLSIEEARYKAGERMGLADKKLSLMLARRDISYLNNVFLIQSARDLEGEISLRVAQGALSDSERDRDSYFRYVRPWKKDEVAKGREFDPDKMETADLKAQIKRMKKDMGIIDEEHATPVLPESTDGASQEEIVEPERVEEES